MKLEKAKELLSALADGVNPLTGEVLGEGDSCNQPDIIRALHTVLFALDKAETTEKKPRNLPDNAGKPWSEEDDKQLQLLYEGGFSVRELCEYFKRTKGSITARLERFGKLPIE